MMEFRLFFFAVAIVFSACTLSATDFDISSFGARPGGTKCTTAFAQAIEACSASGGGRVVVPAGRWFTGAIRLKSDVDLHLTEGSEILFSQDPADYLPAVHTSWEGMECWNYCPLVYAYGCTNVAITGKGTLRAFEGEWEKTTWFDWTPQAKGIRAARLQLYTWGATDEPVEKREIWKMKNAHTRPHFIQFNRCKNVRWEDFKIRNSPFWTLHLYLCDNALVRGLDVYAHGANNDGIDIEMSRDVLVENCTFDQGDDGVVIKSGRNRDAWRLATPTENVLVRNCRIVNAHSLFCIGSEISGGVRNVRMEDCTGKDVIRAVYVKTNRRRGGFVENVSAERISVEKAGVALLAVETDVLYEWAAFPDYELRTTRISGLHLKDVSCREAARRVMIEGDPSSPVENVTLEGVRVESLLLGEYLANVLSCKDDCPTPKMTWEEERSVRMKNPLAVEIGIGRIAPRPVEEEWWSKRHAEKQEEIRTGGGRYDIVFFGDSISHYWEFADKGAPVLAELRTNHTALVLGYGGDRTYNALWRARNGELDGYEAKLVTVLIGCNNWQENSVVEIAADIRELVGVIRQKQPKAKILLMPLLPRQEKHKSDKNAVVSQLIENLPDGKHVFWLDIRKPFEGVPTDLMPDGLHPSDKGYEIWLAALRTYLK